MIKQIRSWVEQNRGIIEETYHQLHQIPEVSWQEIKTRQFLCQQMEKIGIPYQVFDDQTGVVARWEGEKGGLNVGLRADMDALFQNIDGVWQANHSCGHDAHMTMVLHALRCLKEIGFQPQGRLTVIFQPAEETGNGAKSFINKGIVDHVDCLLGIHVRPIQELSFGTASPAIYHGAGRQLKGKIKGVQAHAARPHLGISPVDSLAAVIAAVNAVKGNPSIPMSAKVTMARAGGGNVNTIPDEAEFAIDLRAQTNEAMEELLSKVITAVQMAGRANGAEVEVEEISQMNAAVPHPQMEQIVSMAIAEILGSDAVSPPPVTPGCEDFHFYVTERPHLAATMVGLGTDLQPGLHHPGMHFNLASLRHGVSILAASAVKIFAEYNANHK